MPSDCAVKHRRAMAVMEPLEQKFRERYHVTGEIDSLAWQQFLEELDESEFHTQCYDCKSPDRICGSLLIHLTKPDSMDAEVIIIDEQLGF